METLQKMTAVHLKQLTCIGKFYEIHSLHSEPKLICRDQRSYKDVKLSKDNT